MTERKKNTGCQKFYPLSIMAGNIILQQKIKNNRPKGSRTGSSLVLVINIVIVIICSGTLIIQASQCLTRWLNSESKAILSIEPSSKVTFPSLTVCPSFVDAYNQTFLEEIGVSKSYYKAGDFFGSTSQGTNGYDIFNKATFNLWEMLETMSIYVSNETNREFTIKFEEGKLEYEDVIVSTSYWHHGRCFSFQFSEAVTSLRVVNVEIISNMGVYVYLHHPGQFRATDSKAKVNNARGNKIFVDVTHELNVDTLEYTGNSNNIIKCSSDNDFIYDECVYNQTTSQLAQEFGCIVPYLPQPLNADIPVCRFNEKTEADVIKKRKFMELYYKLAHHGSTALREACLKPCATIEIIFGLPDFGEDQNPRQAYTKIYFRSAVKKNQIVYDYGWVSMVAEIGGYTGLLLGISVVGVTTMLSNFFQKIFLSS